MASLSTIKKKVAPAAAAKKPEPTKAAAKPAAKTASAPPPVKSSFGNIGNPSQKGTFISNPKTVGKQGGTYDFSGVKPLVGFGGVSGGGYIENPNDPGHGWGYNPGLAPGGGTPPGFTGPNNQGPNGAPGPFPTYQTPGQFGPAAPPGSNNEPVHAVVSEAGLPNATEAQRQNFYQRTYGGLGLQAMAPWDIQRHNDKISAMYQKQGKQVPPDKLMDPTYGGMVDPMVANMRNLTPAQKNSAEYKTAMRNFDNYGRRLGGLPVGPPLPNGVQPNNPADMAAATRVQALRAQGAGRPDPYVAPPYSGPPANSKMGANTTASSASGGGRSSVIAGGAQQTAGANTTADSGPPPLTPGPAVPGGNSNIPSSMGGSIDWGNRPQNGPRQMPYRPAPSYPWQGQGGAAIDAQLARPGNSWPGDTAWTDPRTPPPDDSWPWKPGGGNGSVSPGGGASNGAQQKQAQGGQAYGGQTSTSTNAEYNPNQNAAYNNTARQRMNAQMGPQAPQQFGGPVYQPQQQQAPQAPAPAPQAPPQAPTLPQGDNRMTGAWGGSPGYNQGGGQGGNPNGTLEEFEAAFPQFSRAAGNARNGGMMTTGQEVFSPGGWNYEFNKWKNGGDPGGAGARQQEFLRQLQGGGGFGGFGGGVYRGMMGGQFGGGMGQRFVDEQPVIGSAPQRDSTMDWWRNRNGMPQRPGDSDWGGRGDFGGFVPGMGMRSGMKPQQPRVYNDSGFYAPPQAPEQSVTMPRTVGMDEQTIAPSVMPDPMQQIIRPA